MPGGRPGILPSVIALPLFSSFSTMHGTHGFFHSTGFVIARNLAVLLALVFWIALAFWVYKDARRRIGNPILVLFATLLGLVPPYIGPIVYLLFRPSETIDDMRTRHVELEALEHQLARSRPCCPVCSSLVEPEFLACPVCATMLREPCARCNAPLEPLWQICPYCVSPVEPHQVDLDAGLTAELRAAPAGDGAALLPQPEPRVA